MTFIKGPFCPFRLHLQSHSAYAFDLLVVHILYRVRFGRVVALSTPVFLSQYVPVFPFPFCTPGASGPFHLSHHAVGYVN